MTGDPISSEDILASLAAIGAQTDETIDLAEAALALAAAEQPGPVLLAPYRAHLAEIAREMAETAHRSRHELTALGESGLISRVDLLREVMCGFDYGGDQQNYDDLKNADLRRVIDSRRGLPVALSILYMHAARSVGWRIEGVNFPGHFVIRLHHDGKAAILDPFNGGAICRIADLRQRLKSAMGDKAELQPEHYAPMSNRDVLLRLQNNIKIRLIQEGEIERASGVIARMALVAPSFAPLWRELGMAQYRLGKLLAARQALQRFLDLSENNAQRHQAARLIQEIGLKLQ